MEKLKLIEGTFSYEDARDILMNVFNSKINFHHLKNFKTQEQSGKDDPVSQKRIPELIQEIEKFQHILSEAKRQNKALVISSAINISIAED